MTDLIPNLGVESDEEVATGSVPSPAQILSQIGKRFEVFRKDGTYRKSSYSFHALYPTGFTRAFAHHTGVTLSFGRGEARLRFVETA